jgi:hypothetical protein
MLADILTRREDGAAINLDYQNQMLLPKERLDNSIIRELA